MMENDSVAREVEEIKQQQPALDVGATLREAREHMGLSVHDVAERIKFAPKQVEALEANDFVHLPQATFLRGFVRSYARMLHLEEAALISALPSELSKQAGAKPQAVDVAFPTMQSLRNVNVMWLAAALGVALVLGLFVLLHDSEPVVKPAATVIEPLPLPAPEAAVSAVPRTEVQSNAPAATVPVIPEGKTAVAKVAEPQKKVDAIKVVELQKKTELAKVVEPQKKTEAAKVAEPKKNPAAVAKQPAVVSAAQVEPASAVSVTGKPPVPLELLKRRPLHFVFSENAWAEVIDINGSVLLSRSNPAGSEQWVGGPRRAPYNVSISHPGSVKLYYKGKEIDLSSYSAGGIAHLKVE